MRISKKALINIIECLNEVYNRNVKISISEGISITIWVDGYDNAYVFKNNKDAYDFLREMMSKSTMVI